MSRISIDMHSHAPSRMVLRSRGIANRTTILVPLDGTLAAEQALPMAIALARASGSELQLLHVRPVRSNGTTDLVLVDNGCETRFRLRSDCYLERLAERIEQDIGLSVAAETVAGGNVAATIRDVCRKGIDLLVLSRSRRSKLWPWGGSTAERLMRSLSAPMIVVPEEADEPDLDDHPLDRILLPLNCRATSQEIVDRTLKLAPGASQYSLMSVIPLWTLAQSHRAGGGTTAAMASHALELRNQAWFYLRQAQAKLRRAGRRAEASVVFDEFSPGQAIISHAQAYRPDLIALTARPRWIPGWLKPSASQYVVRHSTIPVLVCPAVD